MIATWRKCKKSSKNKGWKTRVIRNPSQEPVGRGGTDLVALEVELPCASCTKDIEEHLDLDDGQQGFITQDPSARTRCRGQIIPSLLREQIRDCLHGHVRGERRLSPNLGSRSSVRSARMWKLKAKAMMLDGNGMTIVKETSCEKWKYGTSKPQS